MSHCRECAAPLPPRLPSVPGRARHYCSDLCRTRAKRRRKRDAAVYGFAALPSAPLDAPMLEIPLRDPDAALVEQLTNMLASAARLRQVAPEVPPGLRAMTVHLADSIVSAVREFLPEAVE